MKKRILITAGSTREAIDEVMTIDNMSTGSIGINLSALFLSTGHDVVMVGNYKLPQTGLFAKLDAPALGKFTFIPITSCDEMLQQMEALSHGDKIDAIIHAAAVGDYKTDYTFLLEDMAAYIGKMVGENGLTKAADIEAAILKAMEDPEFKISNDSKISSNQPNLTVKLGLTVKIISRLREMYPNTLIVGFKLLENVPKDELYSYAKSLCIKNSVDFILANDLAELRGGDNTRHLVDKNGFTGRTLGRTEDIFEFVSNELANKH